MTGIEAAGRWGGKPSTELRAIDVAPSALGKRAPIRDLVTIVAATVAIASIGYALSEPSGEEDGVSLIPNRTAASGASAELASLGGSWNPISTISGVATAQIDTAAPIADLPLVARTEAEHIAQTQSLASVMMPRLAAGEVTGFTIRDGIMPPVLARAGVRPGDVMISINGRALDGNAVVSGLSRDLASAHRADIVVERGGAHQALSTSLRG